MIEYKIVYLQEEIGNFSTGVLPQKMEVVFKEDKVKNTIEGALGFFHLINIADLDKGPIQLFLSSSIRNICITARKVKNLAALDILKA